MLSKPRQKLLEPRRSDAPDPLGFAPHIGWSHRDKAGKAVGRPRPQFFGASPAPDLLVARRMLLAQGRKGCKGTCICHLPGNWAFDPKAVYALSSYAAAIFCQRQCWGQIHNEGPA